MRAVPWPSSSASELVQGGRDRETLAHLREQNLTLVTVDEPQGFHSSVPAVWEATSPDLAVVRFHGRNAETWTKRNSTAAERFNYLYAEEELRARGAGATASASG